MSIPLALFESIGGGEVVIILVVILLLFGSTKLPKLARSLGASMTEFKKGLRGESEDESKKLKDSAPVEEKPKA